MQKSLDGPPRWRGEGIGEPVNEQVGLLSFDFCSQGDWDPHSTGHISGERSHPLTSKALKLKSKNDYNNDS